MTGWQHANDRGLMSARRSIHVADGFASRGAPRRMVHHALRYTIPSPSPGHMSDAPPASGGWDRLNGWPRNGSGCDVIGVESEAWYLVEAERAGHGNWEHIPSFTPARRPGVLPHVLRLVQPGTPPLGARLMTAERVHFRRATDLFLHRSAVLAAAHAAPSVSCKVFQPRRRSPHESGSIDQIQERTLEGFDDAVRMFRNYVDHLQAAA
jgi:hypothetical protein